MTLLVETDQQEIWKKNFPGLFESLQSQSLTQELSVAFNVVLNTVYPFAFPAFTFLSQASETCLCSLPVQHPFSPFLSFLFGRPAFQKVLSGK